MCIAIFKSFNLNLYWPVFLHMWSVTGVLLVDLKGTNLFKNRNLPSQLIIANCSTSLIGIICSTPFSCWSLRFLSLTEVCICYHSHRKFIYTAVLLWSEDNISQKSPTTSESHTLPLPSSTMISDIWKSMHDIYDPFRAELFPISYVLNTSQWWVTE